MILIVDDKIENITALTKILVSQQFEVDSALSGEEALKKVLKNEYQLVILDVQMPGMDGFEVAEAISGIRKTSELPIIFLSAVNISKAFITRGYTSGGQDYLVKPVDQHGVREHRYGDLRGAEPQKTAGAPGGNTVAG